MRNEYLHEKKGPALFEETALNQRNSVLDYATTGLALRMTEFLTNLASICCTFRV